MPLVQDSTLVGQIEDPYQAPPGPDEQRVGDSFAAAALSPEGEPDTTYDRVQGEYSLLGNSPTVENVRDLQAKSESVARSEMVQELAINPTSTPEEIEYNARAAVELDHEPTDLLMSYGARMAAVDLSLGANEFRREDERADPIYSRIDQLRAKAHLLQREIYTTEEDIGTGRFIVDMLGGVMPFNEAKSVYAVAREIGLNPNAVDFVRYGELKRKIIRDLKSRTGEDREHQRLKIKTALQEHSGFLGDNHFLRQVLSDEFTEHMDDQAWWHFIDNAVGIIDVFGVTKFGIATVKALSKSALHTTANANTAIRAKLAVAKGTPIDVLKTSNPKVAAQAATEAITDTTGKVASKLGTTREALIEDFAMPNVVPPGSKINVYEGMPSNVLAKVTGMRAKLTDAFHRSTPDISSVLTKREMLDAEAKVLGKYETFFKTKTNTPTSRLEIGEDQMTLTAQFQADEYGGWRSIQDLYDDVAAKSGSESVQDVTVWHRAPDSDDYVDVTNSIPEMLKRNDLEDLGDFTYSAKFDIPISPEWKDVLPDNAVAAGMGWWGKFIQGQQMFNKQIRSDFSVAVDRVGFFNRTVGDVVKESFKDVGGSGINLYKKNKDYDAVISTLREGAIEEKWYTPRELLNKNFTEDQMTAYYGFKEASDIMYRATAHDLYKTLNREGLSSLTFPGKNGDEAMGIFGRGMPLEEAQSHAGMTTGAPIQAYNPATGRTISIGDSAKVAKLYNQGKRIAVPRGGADGKLGTFSDDGENFYNFLIIDEVRGARIDKLSKFPTPYREGHYFRSYKDDNFIIRYTSPNSTLNGVKDIGVGKAIGVVRNKNEAELFIKAEMDRLGTRAEDYTSDWGTKWHEGRLQNEDDWDLIQSASLKSNRARGEHLRGLDDKLAQIEDPVEALGRTISAVSNRLGKRDVLEANQAAWHKTYGNQFKQEGQWPSDRAALKKAVDSKVTSGKVSDRIGKEALAYYDYIEMNRGVGAPISDAWKNWVFKTMSNSDRDLFRSIAPNMAHLAGWLNPALRLKQSAFMFYIALSPLRQLVLQPTQITNMFVLYPKYMTGGFIREFSAMTAEYIGGKGGKLGKQLRAELDASGITKNIDHHQWINQSQAARMVTGDATKPFSFRNSLYKVAKVPQKVGFEAAEKLNQIVHWMGARNEYKLAHPDANLLGKKHSDAILARFRDLSGSMNAAGKFGYQGWGGVGGEVLSSQMQFMSHSHKMLQMMAPQKMGGGRFLTPKKKLQLALGNVALWGAGLFPFVNKMLNEGQDKYPEIEMSEDLNRVVQRGIVDHMINKGIGVVTGDDPNLQIGKSFVPTGSIEMFATNIYESITNDPLRQWDFAAGIGAASMVVDTIGAINTFWHTSEDGIYGTEDQVLDTIQAISELSSGMSNYGKAKMIAETGKIVSRSGTVIAEASLTEAAAKMFGVTLSSEQSFYDLIEISKAQRESYQDIQDDVRHIHQYHNRMLANRDDISALDKEIILNKSLARRFPSINDKVTAYDEIVKLRNRNFLDGVDSISLRVMENAMRSGDLDELRGFVRNHPDSSPAINKFLDALLSPKDTE